MKKLRIGAGQGFYGDTMYGALDVARYGNVSYICFDCLAELTMSILSKDYQKDASKGYTKDIAALFSALLPIAQEKKIKLITNCGGLNPQGARAEIFRIAKQLNITSLKIAVVTGDNIINQLETLEQQGVDFSHFITRQPFNEVKQRLSFANVYLGAKPIVEALAMGADIVITGRTADPALFLAPMIYEFNWSWDQWHLLSTGILLGHLLECSAQSTGGNFSGKWWEIEGFERIGYPICEIYENGLAYITKAPHTGGAVTLDTVKEQLYYEVHNPAAYFTPDVIADWSDVRLIQAGPDLVEINGARGNPAPPSLKVVMGYEDGFLGQGFIGYSWPDALKKARKAEEIIRKQCEQLKINYQELHVEYLGYNSIHGPMAHAIDEEALNEIYLRAVIRTPSKSEAYRFGKLFPPLSLNGPPFISGLYGLYDVRPLSGLWATLIPRHHIEENIRIDVEEVL